MHGFIINDNDREEILEDLLALESEYTINQATRKLLTILLEASNK